MKNLLLQVFTWWRGQTLGVRFYTWRKGVRVGEDQNGNVYYRDRDDERRWVIYSDIVEASEIPAGWHGWMHHKTDTPPSEDGYQAYSWELAHKANQTGTAHAYRPATVRRTVQGDAPASDYEAWTP